ncbi:MAM domain-containing protein 2a isoform X3 [Gymnodraco acuticeps]|uniref:MAM domain-containing protein 2a isoform X3 n=1 Tax=Gymnodraco acuticeps TaxID=8218 RepID=A0A6P8SWX5_GYMAC|nr:MAM domain-containing protein 2a isoform X3 [Gymnodraco acuticeps]
MMSAAWTLCPLLTVLLVVRLLGAQQQLLPGSCNFELGTCGYTSDPEYGTWSMNEEGHVITVDSAILKEQQQAVLVSPVLDHQYWSCVRLVYQITGGGSLQLFLRPDGDNFDYRMWTANQASDSWLIASVDLPNSTTPYQVLLEGRPERGSGNSVAIFEIHIVTGYCIECNFEEHHLCGYSNSWNPNVNWYVGGSVARVPESHLPVNHSTHHQRGHYMYVDSVYAKHFQEVAKLSSPMTTVPLAGCLSFYYNRDQERGNIFSLFTRDQLGHYEDMWRPEVFATAGWTLVSVDIKAPHPLEVVFEVAFNSARGGYVAIDDISFSPEFCHTDTEPNFDPSIANCDFEDGLCLYHQEKTDSKEWSRVSVKPNAYRIGDHTTGVGFLPGQCDFESGVCGYIQDKKGDKADWLRVRGHTPTSYTGPRGDHTTGVGYFMYIEASLMRPGHKARLLTSDLRGSSSPQCLILFYHMHGSGSGILSMLLRRSDREQDALLWRRRGEQSVSWMRVMVDYQCDVRHQIIFEAIRGPSLRSDIAIDDISFKRGQCEDPGDFAPYSGFSEYFNEIEK